MELVNEQNPFRRPVRPHDLGFLDYGKPLAAGDVLKLSGLLGHRMLRNVYDADLLFLPGPAGHPSRTDAAAFYSAENRLLGRRAAAVLEHHLFDWLSEGREPLPGGGARGLEERVLGVFEERRSRPSRALEVALGARHRADAAAFALVQLTAVRPAVHSAVGRNLIGDYDAAHPTLRHLLLEDFRERADRAEDYRALLAGAGLSDDPYAYWQFFLSSSLAGANHLHRLAHDHERVLEFLGAWVHHRIDESVTAAGHAELVREGFGIERPGYFADARETTGQELVELTRALLAPLLERFGGQALESFHTGFEDARRLARVADEDLAVQLDWADRLDEYKAKAEKLEHRIRTEHIEVDLETFVESSEETSTTHVHDDHRLVVVEVGQMHFWNNVGQRIPMSEGDKLLIPAERLHGSVVLSGTCTYHQPVIPEDMLRSV
ncbi:hypothetical protein [Streptomyces sp. URMC 123]|uniref:hypothetical protein n=1 Tax=Streptomyces sp. URMC 123 TaxID=3423403 RepID=UPI003F1A0482